MMEAPEIFIFKDGNKLGPYTKAVLEESLRVGSLPGDIPSWTVKNRRWRPLEVVIKERNARSKSTSHEPPSSNQETGKTASEASGVSKIGHAAESAKSAIYKYVLVSLCAVALSIIVALMRDDDGRRRKSVAPAVSTVNQGSPEKPTLPFAGITKTAKSLEEAEKCVLMATTSDSNGSAFVALTNGRLYVYTNVHVAAADRLKFIDFNGDLVRHESIGEVVEWNASDHKGVDLVRFPLSSKVDYALSFKDRIEIESRSNVWALGDSGGENILKSLPGRITGIGPDKIEVDCEFIPGNSGGPIVNEDGKVVGVASYMKLDKSPWAKGTEQEIRRIGWIIHSGYKWGEVTCNDLVEESRMIDDSINASLILIAVMELKASPEGFVVGDYLSDLSKDIILSTQDHPLNKGIVETSNVVAKNSERGADSDQNFREYVRFYASCVDYHESTLLEADRKIKSAYFRNRLEPYMANHEELREKFISKLNVYRRSSSPYRALGED